VPSAFEIFLLHALYEFTLLTYLLINTEVIGEPQENL